MNARWLFGFFAFAACASPTPPAPAPPREPVEQKGPEARALPQPDAGTQAPPPAPASPLHLVLESALPDLSLVSFERGAAITSRSLFVTVDADRVSQEPRFLRGLPEWINWDASVGLEAPSAAKIVDGLPLGTHRFAHAGNRHGPGFDEWWTKTGWSKKPPSPDPRLKKLPKPATAYGDSIDRALPSGDLVVVRYEAEIESFVLGTTSGTPTRSVVPMAPGIQHVVLGEKSDDLYLCETSQGLVHFDGKSWSEVELERKPVSCAMTRDGVLWVVVDAWGSEPPKLIVRREDGWNDVPLPAGLRPDHVSASADRVWLAGTFSATQRLAVYSNQPVTSSVSVEESNLPGPLWIDGITGLDVATVDVVSVSATPAGPGTSACTSLVAWLGEKLTPELERAIGTPRPRVIETAGIVPGAVAPTGNGAQMSVVSSGKKRLGVAVLPKTHAEGVELVTRVRARLPALGARLLCAQARIVRDL